MGIEIKVPVLPESVSEATIATWHKKPGESIDKDEHILDIETDKIVLEVTAPEAGSLEKILKKEGDTVGSEEVVALFSVGQVAKAAVAEPVPESTVAPKASPSVRRLAGEKEIDLTEITGSGKGGRIERSDLEKPAMAVSEQKRVPMTRLRARIAERLLQAQQNAAILTTFNEINMKPVMDLRKKYKEKFEKEYGVRLGFMSFFIMASLEALKRFPIVNASVDGNDILYHNHYDISVAVSSPRGLVVPVIRGVENLTMAEIERQISEYALKAKEGKLSMEEISGGTFTISNGGVFGSLLSTPILNPPQSAILGMHKIEDRAVVEENQVVIRPMMYVALSYDHRIIDGSDSVQFLVTIKELLEDPARFLLEL